MPVAVRGMRELSAAFAKADRQARLGLTATFREVAEPVRSEAEQLAQGRIVRIGRKWYKMRTGVTRKVVYVAPRQRGVKTRHADDPRRRPQFAGLLMERAMEPALTHHQPEIERAVERALDRIADDFNH